MYSIANIRQQISDRGFYVGNVIEDLVTPHNKKDFDYQRQRAIKESFNTDNLFYMSCIAGLEGNAYPINLSYSQIEERRTLIKEKNFQINQQWHYFGNESLSWWNDFVTPVLKTLYTPTSGRFRFDSRFSLYKNGDFTDNHRDSAMPTRFCAVLLYLTDESEYNDGGGEIVLYNSNTEIGKTAVLPLFPTYIILDIKNHSLHHEVLPVKNDFSRLAFLSFVHEWEGWP